MTSQAASPSSAADIGPPVAGSAAPELEQAELVVPDPAGSELAEAAVDAAIEAAVEAAPTRNDQTLQLLLDASQAVCPEERTRLLDEAFLLNIGTAEGIASRYRGRGVDWEDLLQVAYVGLVKAVRGFRAEEGASFLAYANPTISGEIKRHFRDFAWTVRPPRRIQELQGAVQGVEPELVQSLGRPATASELAHALAVDLLELREALTVEGCFAPLSLDAPAHAEAGATLGDLVPDVTDEFERIDRLQTLVPVITALTPRERQILVMRFVRGLTQAEIGAELGVSQMQVSRLLRDLLRRLRDALVTVEDVDADGPEALSALD